MTRMPIFSSDRERRLWFWSLATVAAIGLSLGLGSTLAGELLDSGLVGAAFWLGLFLVGAAVVVQGLRRRPGGAEIGVALGVAGAYLLAFLRMTIPSERSHLIEYSVLALFIHEALVERAENGRRVPAPALLALAMTVLLGWLDEGVQALLPDRVYDLRDVGFNALAGLMAITAKLALSWARRRFGRAS